MSTYIPQFSTEDITNALRKIPYIMATPIEKEFIPTKFEVPFMGMEVDFGEMMHRNYVFMLSLVSVYMAFCYFGKRFMAEREAFDLRLPLAGWNAFLSIFSFIGVLRTLPTLIADIISKPYQATVCTRPLDSWGVGPTGFWVMLFIFSKIPELVDTIFIVLRKKPLIFLHWYHHVTVLMYCWNAYETRTGSGLWFVVMNYSVHSIMYGYYCLQALHLCPKSFPTYLITLSQIGQMFVGTGVCISGWYFLYKGEACAVSTSNLVAGALMYGSYLYLFCAFAVKRYIFKKPKPAAKKLQ